MSRSKRSLKSRDEGHHVTVRHHHVCDDPRPITRLLVNTSLCGLDSSPSWQFGVRETCCTWRRQHKYDQNLTSVDARLPRARSSREQVCTLLLLQILSHSPACLRVFFPPSRPGCFSYSLLPFSSTLHLRYELFLPSSPCPIWQSQTEQQLTAHSFASSDWWREPPGSESSPTALLWLFSNGVRQEMIVHVVEVVSRFKVVSSVFSWWWKEEEVRCPDPCSSTSSLIFSLCFSSPFLFYLTSWPFSMFFCCLVWRSVERCRKCSSADWSESGKLIFTSIRWVKTLPPQLRISDYQPSKMISWTEVILKCSSSISPLGLPGFYFRSLSSVWDRANVISLVPLPHHSCHFILDYILLSAFYTSFFYQCSLFTIICSNSEDFMNPTFLIKAQAALCSKHFFLLGSLWCQWQRTEAPPTCWRRSYSSLLPVLPT